MTERTPFNLRVEYIWLACGIPEREIDPDISHVEAVLTEAQSITGEIDPADGYVILNAIEVAAIILNPYEWLIFERLYQWVTRQQIAPSLELHCLACDTLVKLKQSKKMRSDWQKMITPDYVRAWADIGLEPGFNESWDWDDILNHIRARL